jgi:predicted double-glycine peptidase
MKQQDSVDSCGPTALANGLEAYHGRATLTPQACATLCKTDCTGTDERRMRAAIKGLDMQAVTIRSYHELMGRLTLGDPVLLVVDGDSHWVTAIGLLGARVVLADPADGGLVTLLDAKDLLERWRGLNGRYYGLALVPPGDM